MRLQADSYFNRRGIFVARVFGIPDFRKWRRSGTCALHPVRRVKYTAERRLSSRTLRKRGRTSAVSGSRQPLVTLIGWLGAKERHFNKYLELWNRLDCPTFGVRPRTSSILVPCLGDVEARKFLQDLQEQRDLHPDRQLLFHIFSNAGFLFMGTVLRLLALRHAAAGEQKFRIRSNSVLKGTAGIVLDSAPVRLTPDISARGFTAAALGLPAAGIQDTHPRLVGAAQQAFKPLLGNPAISRRSREVWHAWQAHAPSCPQLFMYSTADVLIPPEEVRRFQASQEARGVHVEEAIWTDSPHCEHFRLHPEEYTERVRGFARSCTQRA